MHIKGIPIFATNMHSLSDTDTINLATGLKAYPGDLHVSSKDMSFRCEGMHTAEVPYVGKEPCWAMFVKCRSRSSSELPTNLAGPVGCCPSPKRRLPPESLDCLLSDRPNTYSKSNSLKQLLHAN